MYVLVTIILQLVPYVWKYVFVSEVTTRRDRERREKCESCERVAGETESV
jgi:hypothetical protein